MSPAVARNYLRKVAKQFEAYAETRYVSGLKSGEADAATVLEAIRFVETRNLKGHESTLRELFTEPPAGELHNQIAAACVDALIGTTDSSLSTARFLVRVATSVNPLPTSALAEQSLWRLRPTSEEALLVELARPYGGRPLGEMARLLVRLCDVRSPKPFGFWKEADAEQRSRAADLWRERIRKARKTKGR